MKHLDVTFDFETCSLLPTAAPISLGAVAWNRYDDENPFVGDKNELVADFYEHIDLRYAFLDGFTFDQSTADWWKTQSDEAKHALLADNPMGMPLVSVKACVTNFFEWLSDVCERVGAETVCLWSQGSDFDIPILKNICSVYNLSIPVIYKNFRDHRTVQMELAESLLRSRSNEYHDCLPAVAPGAAYGLVKAYDAPKLAHQPVYDCRKSIYSTWQLMKLVDKEITKINKS